MGVVNTFVNSGGPGVNKAAKKEPQSLGNIGANYVGGGEGNRTLGPLHAKYTALNGVAHIARP